MTNSISPVFRGSRSASSPRGVYLITGGLGGLGLVVAAHLGLELNARLVLISRSQLPPESTWESAVNDPSLAESTRDRIRQLLRIRAVSGGLLLLQADVTSIDQMRSRCRPCPQPLRQD